jgi:cell division protein FtsB
MTTIDSRIVIETVVGLLLSGFVSLAIYAINSKVNQRYLELKVDLAQNYVTNKALEALIVRFERSLAKLEEQLQVVERLESGFASIRRSLPN